MRRKIIYIFIIIAILMIITIKKVNAETLKETNENTIIIEDDANLLTLEEEQQLKNQMATLSEYGVVLFKTTSTSINTSSLRYIQNYYYAKFGNKNGVAFYIDMNNRQICACASGGLERTITSGKCDTIMDNVYKFARKGNYYECAKETYLQMNKLLSGQKIAESMKYICNALISIMISLFVSYGVFMIASRNKKASRNDLVKECEIDLKHSDIEINLIGTHSVYSPRSDNSSSGGGSSSGGSHGGGGFSGSGGSHGF